MPLNGIEEGIDIYVRTEMIICKWMLHFVGKPHSIIFCVFKATWILANIWEMERSSRSSSPEIILPQWCSVDDLLKLQLNPYQPSLYMCIKKRISGLFY